MRYTTPKGRKVKSSLSYLDRKTLDALVRAFENPLIKNVFNRQTVYAFLAFLKEHDAFLYTCLRPWLRIWPTRSSFVDLCGSTAEDRKQLILQIQQCEELSIHWEAKARAGRTPRYASPDIPGEIVIVASLEDMREHFLRLKKLANDSQLLE